MPDKNPSNLIIQFYGISDLGLKRNENQDSWAKYLEGNEPSDLTQTSLFIVADGMGGHDSGKEASNLAVDVVKEEFSRTTGVDTPQKLQDSFSKANNTIFKRSDNADQQKRMGTTCTALAFEDQKAFIAHVGDSRVYCITKKDFEQLTEDHTQVAELVKHGILNSGQAENHPRRSILNRALGVSPDVEIDLIENIAFNAGDFFVLCTDGLAKVTPSEIKSIVLKYPLKEACQKLINFANERGGEDNVTVVIVQITSKNSPKLSSKKIHSFFHRKLFRRLL